MSDDKLILRSNPLAKQLGKSLKTGGSLIDLVRVRQDTNIFMLLDCSGSMGSAMKNGKSRMEGLREAVRDIQAEKEMRMVQFGWSNEPSFITSIPDASGGTPLHLAITFAKNNGSGRAIVISDGYPDDQQAALRAAQDFGGRIDVVFVGDPGESGEAFLKMLAESTGGTSFTGDLTDVKQLTSQVLGLLGDGRDEDDDDE